MIFVLDTNSIIYYLQDKEALFPIFDKIKQGEIFPVISVITRIELLSFPKIIPEEENKIESLLFLFEIQNIDDNIVEATVEIRKKYGLKIPDAIVAATALINDGTLVTRNEKDFKKVSGLKIINPFNQNIQ